LSDANLWPTSANFGKLIGDSGLNNAPRGAAFGTLAESVFLISWSLPPCLLINMDSRRCHSMEGCSKVFQGLRVSRILRIFRYIEGVARLQ